MRLTMVVTPGPPSSRGKDQAGLIAADEADLSQVDTVNYKTELVSDAQGRLTLPVLIPGATYRFVDYTMVVHAVRSAHNSARNSPVKPGEILDLGDIVIEKPRATPDTSRSHYFR